MAFTACVCVGYVWGGGIVSESKTITKTAAIVRDVNKKTKYNGQEKIITKTTHDT